MEKTIEVGRFKVPLKGMQLADWFLYKLMDKFGDETFFSHWDKAAIIRHALTTITDEEERKKVALDLKGERFYSSMWWEENVLSKERISEEEYTEWARGLYEEMPKRLYNKTSKKEYQNVVSELTFTYGPKFTGDGEKDEEAKKRLATPEGVPTGTSEG